jgi:hypothetical protein
MRLRVNLGTSFQTVRNSRRIPFDVNDPGQEGCSQSLAHCRGCDCKADGTLSHRSGVDDFIDNLHEPSMYIIVLENRAGVSSRKELPRSRDGADDGGIALSFVASCICVSWISEEIRVAGDVCFNDTCFPGLVTTTLSGCAPLMRMKRRSSMYAYST